MRSGRPIRSGWCLHGPRKSCFKPAGRTLRLRGLLSRLIPWIGVDRRRVSPLGANLRLATGAAPGPSSARNPATLLIGRVRGACGALNVYGRTRPAGRGEGLESERRMLSFLEHGRSTPPSLLFLPDDARSGAALAAPAVDGGVPRAAWRAGAGIGKVPMFYYALHLPADSSAAGRGYCLRPLRALRTGCSSSPDLAHYPFQRARPRGDNALPVVYAIWNSVVGPWPRIRCGRWFAGVKGADGHDVWAELSMKTKRWGARPAFGVWVPWESRSACRSSPPRTSTPSESDCWPHRAQRKRSPRWCRRLGKHGSPPAPRGPAAYYLSVRTEPGLYFQMWKRRAGWSSARRCCGCLPGRGEHREAALEGGRW